MLDWQYNEKAYEEKQFEIVPVGDHRVRIEDVQEKESKSTGFPMLEITLAVSGHPSKLWYYLVFNRTEPQKTDRALGAIFDSFSIQPGNLNARDWIGRVGGARIRHEIYEGQSRPRVAFFLAAPKVKMLPPWQGSDPALNGDFALPFEL